jgi:3-oxoacyl-[acyl-carrier protein] reductase
MPGAPSTYSAAKAAIHGWVRSVARPLAVKGVRINTIAPGNIVFEGSVWYRMLKEDPQKVQKILKNEVAMNRLGKLEEVADFVAFLSSPRASFCTGGIYLVDGGQSKS